MPKILSYSTPCEGGILATGTGGQPMRKTPGLCLYTLSSNSPTDSNSLQLSQKPNKLSPNQSKTKGKTPCAAKKSNSKNQKNHSHAQHKKHIKKILVLTLCAAVYGCNTTTCHVTTRLTLGEQKTPQKQGNTLSSLASKLLNKTNPVKFPAENALDADSSVPDNGRYDVSMNHNCMTKTASLP